MNSQETPNMKYETNYITNVIFRIDFPKILDLKEPTSKLQKKILDKFPIVNEINVDNFQFKVENRDLSTKKTSEDFAWEFVNKDNDKKVFIASEYAYIEFMKYINFEQFYEDIELVFKAFNEFYPVGIIRRVGLRYINEIEIEDGEALDWENLIHHSLYSLNREFIPNDVEDERLLRSMHLFEIKEDDYNLKFQLGLFNSEYPNPISKKEFVLDYDCSTKNVEKNEIFNVINEFHQIIKKWFERSIEDGLRSNLGVLNDS